MFTKTVNEGQARGRIFQNKDHEVWMVVLLRRVGTWKSEPARYIDANGQLIGYHLDSGVAVRFVGDDNEPISIPLTRAGIAPSVAYLL